MMIAKFVVPAGGVTKPFDGAEEIRMMAVTDKPFDKDGNSDDNSFARWTPNGELKMTITNPALHGKIVERQKFYLNFTLADS